MPYSMIDYLWPLPFLAVVGTTGGLSGLVLGLLREIVFRDSPFLDLLLGILLDLTFFFRLSVLRLIRRRIGGGTGWYRVLDE